MPFYFSMSVLQLIFDTWIALNIISVDSGEPIEISRRWVHRKVVNVFYRQIIQYTVGIGPMV